MWAGFVDAVLIKIRDEDKALIAIVDMLLGRPIDIILGNKCPAQVSPL